MIRSEAAVSGQQVALLFWSQSLMVSSSLSSNSEETRFFSMTESSDLDSVCVCVWWSCRSCCWSVKLGQGQDQDQNTSRRTQECGLWSWSWPVDLRGASLSEEDWSITSRCSSPRYSQQDISSHTAGNPALFYVRAGLFKILDVKGP